jgi:hypothetical protein
MRGSRTIMLQLIVKNFVKYVMSVPDVWNQMFDVLDIKICIVAFTVFAAVWV